MIRKPSGISDRDRSDDGMATKNEESSGTINSKNILHEHIVVYNNSVGTKVGTKSMGQTVDGTTFKDVDVVKAGRGMTIECYDTAVVSNVTFENIQLSVQGKKITSQTDSNASWSINSYVSRITFE